MEENGIVEAFYQRVDEEERLADRQGYVEYATTMSYIHKYLEPHMRIAEIGTLPKSEQEPEDILWLWQEKDIMLRPSNWWNVTSGCSGASCGKRMIYA